MTRAISRLVPTALALALAAGAAPAETLRPKFDPDKLRGGPGDRQQVLSRWRRATARC